MQAQTRQQFLLSDGGVHAKSELQRMTKSTTYNTPVAYDVSVGRELTFADRHINYLTKHPYINPTTYLANLRVMTKASR